MKFVSTSILDQDKEVDINANEQQGTGSAAEPQEYDPRTLFERLQEQRTIKEEQFQEATRLSNLIKRVDDEEAEYFQSLLDVQDQLEQEQRQKERDEIVAYRRAVEQARTAIPTETATIPLVPAPAAAAAAASAVSIKKQSVSTTPAIRKSSKNALEGLVVVKKKRGHEQEEQQPPQKKVKTDDKAPATAPKSTSKTTVSSGSSNTLSTLLAAYSSDSSDDE